MTSRIRGWQAKNLTYAARLQLINLALMKISSFWYQMFILLKKVINYINAICISFLWFGIADSHKPRKLNLKQVFKPKKYGLGIRDVYIWNQVAVDKIT